MTGQAKGDILMQVAA